MKNNFDNHLHTFCHPTPALAMPERFTYPFCYTPHPACVRAARQVQDYLAGQTDWQDELRAGKMFGVMIVRTESGETAFIAAFSGILAGSNQHPYFVPPVYDLLQSRGFFKPEEQEISDINRRIAAMETDSLYRQQKDRYTTFAAEASRQLTDYRAEMKAAKAKRHELRAEGRLTAADERLLTGESQFQKAEYKRREQAFRQELDRLQAPIAAHEQTIKALKEERKSRSAALQLRIFSQFKMLNAKGEQKDLCQIFSECGRGIPPAGAGECAAPKLLQYAYLHALKPIAMAEFWWGESPKAEVREQGSFYPACQSKCEPILHHMLQGLDVEENPLSTSAQLSETSLSIVYEDEWLMVVNKPAGMLSVPGKEAEMTSVWSLVRKLRPDAAGPLIVHRLDMDTSGLLLIAKTCEVHRKLQAQFEARSVKKRYVALLSGHLSSRQGTLILPICPDLTDRPRQMVSQTYGKQAVTHYEVLGYEGGNTRVAFRPVTGRTHQLRVHAAHALGLHCPIIGDALYGTRANRLHLHAEVLEFEHPVSGRWMKMECPAEF